MNISGNCKKMMAFVVAFTMVLSVLFVPGKGAKAATTAVKPSVTVLGATIRLNDDRNDNNGTQSLMIGIRVDHADKASACAITITSGSRAYTVATRADKIGELGKVQTTVHSKDESAKSIVYAVVVTGIGPANFNTNLGIQGKVWDLEGTEITSGAPIQKSVYSVVTALQSAYPSLYITLNAEGVLCRGNGASPLTAEDLANAGGNAEDPAPVPTPSVVAFDAQGNNLGSGVINPETGDIEIGNVPDDDPNAKVPVSLMMPIDHVNVGETIQVHITGTINQGSEGFRLWPNFGPNDGNRMADASESIHWHGTKYSDGTDDFDVGPFDITKNMVIIDGDKKGNSYANYILIKAPAYDKYLNNLIISSVEVVNLGNLTPPTPAPTPNYGWDINHEYYTLELNNTNVTYDGGSHVTYNFDGSVSISSDGNYPGIWFRLPAEAQVPMQSVTFTYTAVEGDGFGHCYRYTDSNSDEDAVWGGKFTAGHDTETINIQNQTKDFSGVKLFVASENVTGRSVTITSAVFHKAPTDTELDINNLVSNGNFANGNTGWSSNFNTTIDAVGITGTHAGFVKGRWNSYSGPKTTITGTFTRGDILTYQFSVLRSNTLDASYNNRFVIKFSESGTEHQSNPTTSSDGPANAVGDADHWLTYYGTYTVQEDTNSIGVIIMEDGYVAYDENNPSANYNFYIDDVQVVRTYEVIPTPVPAYDSSDALNASSAVAWKVNTPIVADGTFDDAWADIPYYKIANYEKNEGETQAIAKVAWDENNLYALIRVKDPSFNSTNSNNWERDGGELFLDENNSKETSYDSNSDAFQYRLTGFDNSPYTNEIATGSQSARTSYAGIVAVPKFVDDGYIMEYKIPWRNAASIVEGKVIGFELAVFDCSNGSRYQEIHFITNGGALYQNPSLYGNLWLAGNVGEVDWYQKINNISELQNNDRVLIIYPSKNKILLPNIVNGDNSDTGFELVNFSTDGRGNIIGDHSASEWTFEQSGSGWKLKSGSNYATLGGSSVSLNSSGSEFTISSRGSGYTFESGNNYFNDFYGRGTLISGWSNPDQAISFDLYRYNGRH